VLPRGEQAAARSAVFEGRRRPASQTHGGCDFNTHASYMERCLRAAAAQSPAHAPVDAPACILCSPSGKNCPGHPGQAEVTLKGVEALLRAELKDLVGAAGGLLNRLTGALKGAIQSTGQALSSFGVSVADTGRRAVNEVRNAGESAVGSLRGAFGI
jgi:hypothetical protein